MTPDADQLYAEFLDHVAHCPMKEWCQECQTLLMRWGAADVRRQQENAAIDDLNTCADDAEVYGQVLEPYELDRDDHPPFAGEL